LDNFDRLDGFHNRLSVLHVSFFKFSRTSTVAQN
jgi:hypothetical protein